jgi:hypothetical protein
MPTFTGTQTQASGPPDLEDGYYDAAIAEVAMVQGKFDEQLQVRFRCLDEKTDNGEPVEFMNWYTPPKDQSGAHLPIRIGTKLGDLFSAALFDGEPYPEGTSLNTDDLIGRVVRVNWGEYMTKPFNGRPAMQKTGVIGVKKSKRNKQPVAAAAKGGTLRKRLVDDDDDDSDLEDA